ncbi:MAG: T9SS type A sorting domain-containing protein [Flavobacteriales bacterium]|nr:T9SS type A sorting domain-containing protein [Flavobacteriales bacterium]
MIRSLLFGFLVLSITTGSHAQRIQSSCNSNDSVKAYYQNDADRLALSLTYTKQTPFADSARISPKLSDSVMRALIAVYNVDSLPARDSIVDIIKVHTGLNPALNRFYLAADSVLFWMQMLKSNITPTTVDSVDRLMKNYDIKVLRYYIVNTQPYHIVVFESGRNFNYEVISNLFDSLGGVHYSNIYKFTGDGNNITIKKDTSTIELTYSYGWGDCLSQCTFRRYWKFRVFADCSVEYLGSYGHKYVPSSVKDPVLNGVSVSPNPFYNSLKVSGLANGFMYQLIDQNGRLILEDVSDSGQISGLESVPQGLYVLRILSDQRSTVFKVIKN